MSSVRKLERFRGHARLETVRIGTASEHAGVVLETSGGERLKLVRLGGNPFDDAEARKWSGRTIEVQGYRVGSELRYVSVQDAD